ncbi:uncharacterized protein LOC118461762 isoform X2 [Anopheles albimanus]|uniref:uncharacterized protein LOC118461762 isoform X2 n=1 Tax=Anopheles albimanus TaxID=7167 RepID=UPI0016421AEB|nr:uncharacterized protein LOC118461762 isoform X2 [Anopheles albimanus]
MKFGQQTLPDSVISISQGPTTIEMDKYDENILRLNIKIRDLLTQIDRLESKNRILSNENSVLIEDVANFRAKYGLAEEARLKCKQVAEKELERSQQQHEAYQLLKKRYNELIKEYVAQNQKLQSLESVASTKTTRKRNERIPVEIIGSVSDINKPKALEEKIVTLERRCSALEMELAKAYTMIDDLEFELETVDHLENMNEELERQIKDLKVDLDRYRRFVPSELLSADTVTSSMQQTPSSLDNLHEAIQPAGESQEEVEGIFFLSESSHAYTVRTIFRKRITWYTW